MTPSATATATATLTPTATPVGQESQVVGPAGGVFRTTSGVFLTFPPGAVASSVTVFYRPLTDSPQELASNQRLLRSFDLTAIDTLTGVPVTQFAAPLMVAVPYTSTPGQGLLRVAYQDPGSGEWIDLPNRWADDHFVYGETDHFTAFGSTETFETSTVANQRVLFTDPLANFNNWILQSGVNPSAIDETFADGSNYWDTDPTLLTVRNSTNYGREITYRLEIENQNESDGFAGLVFGFQSTADYWMLLKSQKQDHGSRPPFLLVQCTAAPCGPVDWTAADTFSCPNCVVRGYTRDNYDPNVGADIWVEVVLTTSGANTNITANLYTDSGNQPGTFQEGFSVNNVSNADYDSGAIGVTSLDNSWAFGRPEVVGTLPSDASGTWNTCMHRNQPIYGSASSCTGNPGVIWDEETVRTGSTKTIRVFSGSAANTGYAYQSGTVVNGTAYGLRALIRPNVAAANDSRVQICSSATLTSCTLVAETGPGIALSPSHECVGPDAEGWYDCQVTFTAGAITAVDIRLTLTGAAGAANFDNVVLSAVPSAPSLLNVDGLTGVNQAAYGTPGDRDGATPNVQLRAYGTLPSGGCVGCSVRIYDTIGGVTTLVKTMTTADYLSSTNTDYVTVCNPASGIPTCGDGAHSWTAVFVDASGIKSPASAARAFTIDTTAPAAPTIDLDAASDSNVNTDNYTNDATPTITGAAEANSTVTLTFTQGATIVVVTGTATAGGTYSITVPGGSALAEGTWSVTATAADAAGNVSPASAALSITVDTTAPTTTLTGTPPNPSNDSTPTFTFTGADASAVTFQCRVDAAAYAACTSPHTSGALADGSHSFDVYAVDLAGNVDATPATYTWTIDATAPTISIQSISPTVAKSGTVNITVRVFDATSGIGGTASISVSVQQAGGGAASAGLVPGSCVTVPGGVAVAFPVSNTTFDCTYSWTVLTPGRDGLASVNASASDQAGNTGNAAAGSFTADTGIPSSTITVASHNQSYRAANLPSVAGFSGTATDPAPSSGLLSVQYQLTGPDGRYWNGAAWQAISTYVTATGTAAWTVGAAGLPSAGTGVAGCATCWYEGTYHLRSQAIDNAANVEAAGALGTANYHTFVVDLTSPALTITMPAANGDAFNGATVVSISSGGTPGLSGSVSDNLSGIASITAVLSRNQTATPATNECWTGAAWVVYVGAPPASCSIAVSLTAPAVYGFGTTTATWRVSSPPAAGSWGEGQYSLTVTPTDVAGNVGASVVRTFAVDAQPPTTDVVTREHLDYLGRSALPITVVSGTTADATSGVASIAFRIKRTVGAVVTYWNGATWQGASTYLAGALAVPGALSTTWSNGATALPVAPPIGSTTCGGPDNCWSEAVYELDALATDDALNVETMAALATTTNHVQFTIDLTPPSSAIAVPAQNQAYRAANLPSVAGFSGTAADPAITAVTLVEYELRGPDGRYWNGASWQVAATYVPVTAGTNSWTVTANLPAGTGVAGCANCWYEGVYEIRSRATDTAANLESPAAGAAPQANFHTFVVDLSAPALAVTLPAANGDGFNGTVASPQYAGQISSTAPAAQGLRGTVTDNLSGIVSMTARLERVLTGSATTECWTGAAWTSVLATPACTLVVSLDAPAAYGFGTTAASWKVASAPPVASWGEGAFTLTASATDVSGNTSATATRTFTVDTQGPTLTINPPAADDAFRSGQTVNITVTGIDLTSGVDAPGISVTGTIPGPANITPAAGACVFSDASAAFPTNPAVTATCSFTYGVGATGDGRASLTASATDQAGNLGTAAGGFIIDNTPPSFTVVTPTATTAFKSGTVITIQIQATDATSGFTAAPQITVTGPTGVATGPIATSGCTASTPSVASPVKPTGTLPAAGANMATIVCSYTYTVGAGNGNATIDVTGSDRAGNTQNSAALGTFVVDNTNPAATVTEPTVDGEAYNASTVASTLYPAATPGMSGTASDNLAGVASLSGKLTRLATGSAITQCWRPGTGWVNDPDANCTLAFTTTGGTSFGFGQLAVNWKVTNGPAATGSGALAWGEGTFTLTVTPTDMAGNVGAPATRGFYVDSTPPTIAFNAPPTSTIYGVQPGFNTVTVQVAMSDATSGVAGAPTVTLTLPAGSVGAATLTVGPTCGALPSAPGVTVTCDYTYTLPAGAVSGLLRLTAAASDVAGNANGAATSPPQATRDVYVDATAPDVDLAAPVDNSFTNDTTPDLSATATDVLPSAISQSGVATVTFEVSSDGGMSWIPVGNDSTATGSTYSVTTAPALAQGIYLWRATGVDNRDNSALSSATRTFIVDTEAPTAGFTDPVTGPPQSSYNSLTIPSITGASGMEGTASDTGGAGNPSGIASMIVRLQRQNAGGTTYWNCGAGFTAAAPGCAIVTTVAPANGAAVTWSTVNGPSTAAAWGTGLFTLTINAVDRAGNSGAPVSTTFYVDTTAPTSAITSPASGCCSLLATVTGTATDPGAPFASGLATVGASLRRASDGLYWDGAAWQATEVFLATDNAASWTITAPLPSGASLPDGSYTVRSRATDSAGNVETPGAGTTFVVDTTAPSVNITSPVALVYQSPSTSLSVTFSYTEANPAQYVVYVLDAGTGAIATSVTVTAGIVAGTVTRTQAVPLTGLPEGPYHVRVIMTDRVALTATDQENNVLFVDGTLPVSTVGTPATGTVIFTLASVGGTATDPVGTGTPSGINSVTFTLQRVSDSRYWNGAAWAAAPTALATTLSAPGAAATNWTNSGALPSGLSLLEGFYIACSTARDVAGNVQSPATCSTFEYDKVPYVTSFSPDGSGPVSRDNTTIVISLSENIFDNGGGAISLADYGSMFRVENALCPAGLCAATNLVYSFNAATNASTVTITLSGALTEGQTYTIRVAGDGTGIKDSRNNELGDGATGLPLNADDTQTFTVVNRNNLSFTSTTPASVTPPMTTARRDTAAGSIGGIFYVVGGLATDGRTALSTNQAFDPTLNAWVQRTSMPAPRYGHAAVALNCSTGAHCNKLYVFGGANTNGTLDTMTIYNPATNSWSAGRTMPKKLKHLAAAELNGVIFVVGGSNENNIESASLFAYDPVTNSWSTLTFPSLPGSASCAACTGRNKLTLTAAEGKLFAVGGIASHGERLTVFVPGAGFTGAATLNAATTAGGAQWIEAAPASNLSTVGARRNLHGAMVLNGFLYVVGGLDSNTGLPTDDVFVYDPKDGATGTWTNVGAALLDQPRAAFGGQVGVVNSAAQPPVTAVVVAGGLMTDVLSSTNVITNTATTGQHY